MISRSAYIIAIACAFYLNAFNVKCNEIPEESKTSEQSSPQFVHLEKRIVALETLIAKLQEKSPKTNNEYQCLSEGFYIEKLSLTVGNGVPDRKHSGAFVGKGMTEIEAKAHALSQCFEKNEECRISECKKIE
jgi:hypothetical protein